MQGKPLGLLHGIPFAAKDLVNTAGVRTTFGSLLHENNVPKEDAVATARVKQAGAILFGKTTTPEFGHKALTDAPLLAARAMPGAPSAPRPDRAAAQRSRSRPASGRSASRPTAAARRASRRRPTAWSG